MTHERGNMWRTCARANVAQDQPSACAGMVPVLCRAPGRLARWRDLKGSNPTLDGVYASPGMPVSANSAPLLLYLGHQPTALPAACCSGLNHKWYQSLHNITMHVKLAA